MGMEGEGRMEQKGEQGGGRMEGDRAQPADPNLGWGLQVLLGDPQNVKALFRKGQGELGSAG